MPPRTDFANARFPATNFGDYRTVEEKARAYKEWFAEQVKLGKKVAIPDLTWEQQEALHAANGEPAIVPDFVPLESRGRMIQEKDRVNNFKAKQLAKRKLKLANRQCKDNQSKKINKSFANIIHSDLSHKFDMIREERIKDNEERRLAESRKRKKR